MIPGGRRGTLAVTDVTVGIGLIRMAAWAFHATGDYSGLFESGNWYLFKGLYRWREGWRVVYTLENRFYEGLVPVIGSFYLVDKQIQIILCLWATVIHRPAQITYDILQLLV